MEVVEGGEGRSEMGAGEGYWREEIPYYILQYCIFAFSFWCEYHLD